MNYYQTPILDNIPNEEAYIRQLVAGYNPSTSSSNTAIFNARLNQTATQFYTSDYIWVLTDSNYYAFLTLPIQVGPTCRDGPPNFYLKENNSSCVRSISDIQTECKNPGTTSLGINYFKNGFKIINVSFFFNIKTQML